jgi:hypothetical protein
MQKHMGRHAGALASRKDIGDNRLIMRMRTARTEQAETKSFIK